MVRRVVQPGLRLCGRVRAFRQLKGWGWLHCEEIQSSNVFVHLSDCHHTIGQLKVGDELEFELSRAAGGSLRATAVTWKGRQSSSSRVPPPPLVSPLQGSPIARSVVMRPPGTTGRWRVWGGTRRRVKLLDSLSRRSTGTAAAGAPATPVHYHLPDSDPAVVETPAGPTTPRRVRRRRNSGAVAAVPQSAASPSQQSAEAPQSSGSASTGSSRPAAAASGAVALRVCNIPWTVSEEKLREAFEVIGEVQDVELDEDHVGEAVVTFRSAAAARHAVEEYHGGTLNGREIVVRFEGQGDAKPLPGSGSAAR